MARDVFSGKDVWSGSDRGPGDGPGSGGQRPSPTASLSAPGSEHVYLPPTPPEASTSRGRVGRGAFPAPSDLRVCAKAGPAPGLLHFPEGSRACGGVWEKTNKKVKGVSVLCSKSLVRSSRCGSAETIPLVSMRTQVRSLAPLGVKAPGFP